MNGANGLSDIEGKAARECGRRRGFKAGINFVRFLGFLISLVRRVSLFVALMPTEFVARVPQSSIRQISSELKSSANLGFEWCLYHE